MRNVEREAPEIISSSSYLFFLHEYVTLLGYFILFCLVDDMFLPEFLRLTFTLFYSIQFI